MSEPELQILRYELTEYEWAAIDVGTRHLIGGYAEAVVEVPPQDAAALTDVDTPEALLAVRAAMNV